MGVVLSTSHLSTTLADGEVRTMQQVAQTYSYWAETHYLRVQEEAYGGPAAPDGSNDHCTSWESGGDTIKVTTPSSQTKAQHRTAVAAAKQWFPED